MLASDPLPLTDFLDRAETSTGIPAAQRNLLPRARTLVADMSRLAGEVEDATEAARPARQRELAAKEQEVAVLLQRLLAGVSVGSFDDRYRLEGLVATYGAMPRQTGDRLTPDHQPQASVLLYAARRQCLLGRRIQNVVTGDHVSGGLCINLHHFRHVRGRTYGRSPDTGPIDRAVSGNPGNAAAQRQDVVAALRAELNADVARMETVAQNVSDRETWRDVHELPGLSDQQKTTLIGQISRQLVAGERRMAAQNLEALAEPA
jgi:hypothetical protein